MNSATSAGIQTEKFILFFQLQVGVVSNVIIGVASAPASEMFSDVASMAAAKMIPILRDISSNVILVFNT